jgi:hypothetical protein
VLLPQAQQVRELLFDRCGHLVADSPLLYPGRHPPRVARQVNGLAKAEEAALGARQQGAESATRDGRDDIRAGIAADQPKGTMV